MSALVPVSAGASNAQSALTTVNTAAASPRSSLARSHSTEQKPKSLTTGAPASASPKTTATTTLPKLSINSKLGSASPASISTPASKNTSTTSAQQSPAGAAHGQWRHPRMDEVNRRLRATQFDRSNTSVILWNSALILISFGISGAQSKLLSSDLQRSLQPYSFYAYLALRILLLANIAASFAPLLRKKDACEDIPLTPHQRQLLGLPPMSRPATPQEQAQYVTPPRYSRSATPASASSSLFVQASGSPLSGRGGNGFGSPANSPRHNSSSLLHMSQSSSTPDLSRRESGSPYGPSSLRGEYGAERRRLSYTAGRSSPLTVSEFDAAGASGPLETPTKGHRASVGLNSKWLYQKGRASPNTWGTGSVFS